MKKLREEINEEIKKDEMLSKNAFRVSKKTKSFKADEEYEYPEDEDYYEDDAPIINIKFKRDTSSLYLPTQTRQSTTVQKLKMRNMKKDEKKKRKARRRSKNSIKRRLVLMNKLREEITEEINKGEMLSKNALRVSKKTKSIETDEEYDYTEDGDFYEDDAPIINIKFKRDTSSLFRQNQLLKSILVQRLQKSY